MRNAEFRVLHRLLLRISCGLCGLGGFFLIVTSAAAEGVPQFLTHLAHRVANRVVDFAAVVVKRVAEAVRVPVQVVPRT